MEHKVVEISTMSIVKTILILFGFVLLYVLRDVFAILFVVFILTAALSPIVSGMQKKWRVPRIFAVLLMYLFIVAAIISIGYLIIPPVVEQLQNLAKNLPHYVDKLQPLYSTLSGQILKQSPPASLDTASKALGSVGSSLLSLSVGVFGGIVSLVTILVLTLFLLLEEDGVKSFMISLLPVGEKDYIVDLAKKVSGKIGSWLVGELILMALIAVMTLVGLVLLQVPYALTLALLAGILEIIPTVGPILSSIPAVFIAFVLKSPVMAFVVIIFYVLVHQLENQIFVPKVMQKALGLSPIVIIIALLIGAKLGGVFGIMISVPAAAGFSVLIREWPRIRNKISG